MSTPTYGAVRADTLKAGDVVRDGSFVIKVVEVGTADDGRVSLVTELLGWGSSSRRDQVVPRDLLFLSQS